MANKKVSSDMETSLWGSVGNYKMWIENSSNFLKEMGFEMLSYYSMPISQFPLYLLLILEAFGGLESFEWDL